MSSKGLSLRSVLAFSIVITTSLPFVTCILHCKQWRIEQSPAVSIAWHCASNLCPEPPVRHSRLLQATRCNARGNKHRYNTHNAQTQTWPQKAISKGVMAACSGLLVAAYPAKHGVLVVQPGSGHSGDEELAAIGVGASIGHTQRERAIMPQATIKLILELLTPDGCATSSITCMHSLLPWITLVLVTVRFHSCQIKLHLPE